jgi:hypothetical protein
VGSGEDREEVREVVGGGLEPGGTQSQRHQPDRGRLPGRQPDEQEGGELAGPHAGSGSKRDAGRVKSMCTSPS